MKLTKSLIELAQLAEEMDKHLDLSPVVYGSLCLYYHTKIEELVIHYNKTSP